MRQISMIVLLAHVIAGCGAVAPRPPQVAAEPMASRSGVGIRGALGPAVLLAADDLAARARSDWRPAADAGAAPAAVSVTAAATSAPATPVLAFALAAQPQRAAAPPASPASPLAMPTPTPRYTEALGRVLTRHAALDPANRWFRLDLATWVAERRDEYRKTGLKPELALLRAVGDLEQE